MSEVKIPQALLNVIADVNIDEINSHIYTNESLTNWLCAWHEELKRELYDFANNKAEIIRADAIDEYNNKLNTSMDTLEEKLKDKEIRNLEDVTLSIRCGMNLLAEQLKENKE